ncbi:cupredoxin domain-containing protein [Salibacterium aidingense]|uniref:cytochrome c oxidase subunit II n=1 Tax=Salibacterium aidingense TaxID=384933 RepID=UPI0003F51834|nr:cytochrome c oxidase subunit II [Salibacterium aidingense]
MKKALLTTLSIAFLFLLAACGGTDGEDTENAGTTVDITATNWEFNKEHFTDPAGEEVTFHLTSEEGMHGIEIEGTDVNIEGEGSATATLDPGEYTIMCNVPCGEGHEDMVATLTVE